MNTAELKEKARNFGADLIGIAPIAAFRELPPAHNPLAIFPQAESMIVIGRRIPRGTLRGMERQERKTAASFRHFGFVSLEDNYLARTTYDLGIWVEAQGYEAVPMFGYDVEAADRQPLGVPVSEERPAPNVYVDWKFAAEAAGLGKIGRNGLFLTPEYGPLQRFALLLSDFAFEPDRAVEDDPCRGCRACVDACPYGALDGTGRNDAVCRECRHGAIRTDIGRFGIVERIGAVCSRACVAALDAAGKRKMCTAARRAEGGI